MSHVNTPTQSTHHNNKGNTHQHPGGGSPKKHTPSLTARLANCADEGRTGQNTLQKPFFGVLDGLSRRTLVLLPSSAERPSERPLFDSDGSHASGSCGHGGRSGLPRANGNPLCDAADGKPLCDTARAVAQPVHGRTMCDTARAVRRRESAADDHAWMAVRHVLRPCGDGAVSGSFQRFRGVAPP